MECNRDIKETFDKLLNENDTVFIVPHNRPDFDAIGAAIGMALICEKVKKKYFIVINDAYEKLEKEARRILEDISGKFKIVNADEALKLLTSKSLMVGVDVNKSYLVSTQPYLDRFNDIMIIDHHRTDDKTIKTAHMFINEKLSSACEEVANLVFAYNAKLTKDYANYLLAGIILDSNKFSKNTLRRTYITASKLVEKGADPDMANNLFLEDFQHDRAIQRLVDNTDFQTYGFAIASDRDDSGKVYEIEDIAKAADYLFKYNVNATFAIARIDEETISISARSKGIIDVANIMKAFGGGGNEHSAAARVKGSSIYEVKKYLSKILTPGTTIILEQQIDEVSGQRLILDQNK